MQVIVSSSADRGLASQNDFMQLASFLAARKLEFRYMSDGFAPKLRLTFLEDKKFQRAYDRVVLATPPAVPRASSSRVSALGS